MAVSRLEALPRIINSMSNPVKEQVYIWSGRYEAIAARKLDRATTSRVAEWVVSLYPQQKYPAVAVGSSNGALTHLSGIPWLPQTFLIPVARSGPIPMSRSRM